MKIGFLLGNPEISGGTYVIYEHATRLHRLGHDVIIITQRPVTPEQYAWHSSAGELQWLSLEQAGSEHFDVVIATWWQSPFLLKDLDSTHYVYFVQSIETRFFGLADPVDYGAQDHDVWKDICEKTYSFALPMITEAQWIQEYIYDNYNTTPFLVHNGIRKDVYTRTGNVVSSVEKGKLRVLIEGPVDVLYKNVPTSIKLALEADADEIWLLTSSDISDFPGVDRVFSRIPIHETPAIYRSCDVLVKLSYVEGMFGPPLEMFHCGGTAIVYKVTGHDEYIVHEQNSFVVDRDDKDGVVQYLRQLKSEPETLARLKEGAQKTAQQWPDWESCSREFEKALVAITQQRATNRNYLTRYTEEIFESAKPKVKAKVLDTFSNREKKFTAGEATVKDNFAEIYWHCKEEFTAEDSMWKHFRSEEWQNISFEVDVSGFPFWLRIDPSVRVGIITLASIEITNLNTQSEILSFHKPEDFGVLFLLGSVCWIDDTMKNVLFSYGGDPMCILPAVEKNDATVGDRLKITIRLKETSVQQFFKESTLHSREDRPALFERFLSYSWKQRVKRLISGTGKGAEE